MDNNDAATKLKKSGLEDLKHQQKKMKELWDNEDDEAWKNA